MRERLERRPSEDLRAEAAAKAIAPDLAKSLRRAGATRIVLFGSLVDGSFRRDSDIDLAVAGLPEPVLARFERELTQLAGRPVELANFELMAAPLRASIERFGVELA
ncbi:MAG: nucleotidyltransferase family protein [Polyangiaceae bacterium]